VGADFVLGTDSTLVNIHSHFVGLGSTDISTLSYTGRMRLTDENGGVGVTFLSGISDQSTSVYDYHRLRRANYAPSARFFHLAPPDANYLIGDLDSGVDPIVDTWYRFRIEVDTAGPQVRIQANVWEDGQSEPAGFQIDALDTSGLHRTSGTVGVWSMASGSKYWDDLQVVNAESGIPCDDNDACTGGDTCSNGLCIGTPIDCSFLDDVCEVGVCNSVSGLCETAPANEGGLCDDSDICTTDDACLRGICAGMQLNCSFLDDACVVGICNSEGQCETTPANEGGACEDSNHCTPNDICVAGICEGTIGNCTGIGVPPECESILFVDDSATNGLNDGSSWIDAYVNLQDAMAEAAIDCSVVGIWVAQGTYRPDQGGGWTPGDRFAAFQLRDNLGLFGGFAGTETSLDQRDPEANVTILSGDLTGDDVLVACTQNSSDCESFGGLCYEGSCIIRNNTDDNSSVLVIGSGTDNSAVFDGFLITAGRSRGGMINSSGDPTVSNCTFTRNSEVSGGFIPGIGGGMSNFDSNPIVTNCTFFGNSSRSRGGGMWNRLSNPVVTDCTFVANVSGFGGGMYNDSSSPTIDESSFRENQATFGGGMANLSNSDPAITHSTFVANLAGSDGGGEGGGMYNSGSNPTLIGCSFFGNSASGGGGMANYSSSPPMTNCVLSGNAANFGAAVWNANDSGPIFTNCTINANAADSSGGGIFNFNLNTVFPSAINCILWDNTPNQISPGFGFFESSIVQGPGFFPGAIDADPLFVDSRGADDIVGTEDDDLRLLPGSPAIDAGDNGAVSLGVVTDLDGNPRFVDDPSIVDTGLGLAPIVDIGAYEFRLGDCDADGDVDLIDHGLLDVCLTDPGAPLGAGCGCIDLDADGDVDLHDFKFFQWGFGL